MFVSADQPLGTSYATASARLAGLAAGDGLREASQALYRDGVEYLLRVGPAGAVPGVSRLVRVRFTEPTYRDGAMTVGLRWEATGITGGLFPALDADIRLSSGSVLDQEESVNLTLTGSYRPPLGAFGTGLDRLVLRTVATATIGALLARVAAILEGVPVEAGQADRVRRVL